ncbi:MAG TPA: MerR family transcriptional regulator [Anaerolineales bacterium]|nr:MerR family transcriptional regulator [Anaerolineales bacterium]
MDIREIAKITHVSPKTIRYYEEIKLLPPSRRRPNGYRVYARVDVDRLNLVAGLRRLDFSLSEIKELLDLRDRRIAPCRALLDQINKKAVEIHVRMEELQKLEQDLKTLHSLGLTFPTDDIEGKNCVCHLVSTQSVSGEGDYGN